MKRAFLSPGLIFGLRQLRGRALNPLRMGHRLGWYLLRRIFGPRSFRIDGDDLPYFWHPLVVDTERVVEIALGRRFLEGVEAQEVLEVGNVLGVFHRVEHRVLDKYEPGEGIENVDVVGFDPRRRFRRILMLSTLEHVGIDEEPRDEGKALEALELLRGWLEADGRALITVPVGHHPRLDAHLRSLGGAARVTYLKRQSRWNVWRETSEEEAREGRYGSPFPCANVLAVVRLRGSGDPGEGP